MRSAKWGLRGMPDATESDPDDSSQASSDDVSHVSASASSSSSERSNIDSAEEEAFETDDSDDEYYSRSPALVEVFCFAFASGPLNCTRAHARVRRPDGRPADGAFPVGGRRARRPAGRRADRWAGRPAGRSVCRGVFGWPLRAPHSGLRPPPASTWVGTGGRGRRPRGRRARSGVWLLFKAGMILGKH